MWYQMGFDFFCQILFCDKIKIQEQKIIAKRRSNRQNTVAVLGNVHV